EKAKDNPPDVAACVASLIEGGGFCEVKLGGSCNSALIGCNPDVGNGYQPFRKATTSVTRLRSCHLLLGKEKAKDNTT
ncbi:MAG: hypothetical protein IKV35_02380, partial [Clostridia bacterium]|nr:hypothetical protein [Clostridia bacterium]